MSERIDQALQLLNRTARLLKDDSIKQKVESLYQEIKMYCVYPKTKVSLCGKFNAGKSALINAILNNKVVISRAIPSTGVITRIYYNGKESYSVVKNENGRDVSVPFSGENLGDVTVKDNFNQSENVRGIVRVDIGIPNDLLKGDVELYDTPGLEDADNNMDIITMNHLDQSDFIVFVVDCLQLKDLKELLMRYYKRKGKNVIFVANKMDALYDYEQKEIVDLAKVYFSEYYNPITFTSDIFFVSAKTSDTQIDKLASYCKQVVFKNAKKVATISRLSTIKYELQNIYDELKQFPETELDKKCQWVLRNDKNTLSQALIKLIELIKNAQLQELC